VRSLIPALAGLAIALPIACSLAYPVDPLSNGARAPEAGAAGGGGAAGCVADADCDDAKSCTKDACASGKCTHTPLTGDPCTGNDPCNDPTGTCNGFGDCATTPMPDTTTNCEVNVPCPSGYYLSALGCDPFCPTNNGVCDFCINDLYCKWACADTMTVCCASDCGKACPTGYHVVGDAVKSDQCAVCGMPQDAVTCSR